MTDRKKSVAMAFLSSLAENKTPITLFLKNGVKLSGRIAESDTESLVLARDGAQQLVFLHAIATLSPGR